MPVSSTAGRRDDPPAPKASSAGAELSCHAPEPNAEGAPQESPFPRKSSTFSTKSSKVAVKCLFRTKPSDTELNVAVRKLFAQILSCNKQDNANVQLCPVDTTLGNHLTNADEVGHSTLALADYVENPKLVKQDSSRPLFLYYFSLKEFVYTLLNPKCGGIPIRVISVIAPKPFISYFWILSID